MTDRRADRQPMTDKFTEPLVLIQIPEPPYKPPTALQINATGQALPAGLHLLSRSQQEKWFGVYLWAEPVEWDDDKQVFVAGGKEFSAEDIIRERNKKAKTK